MTDSVNCSALAESMRRAMCDMLVSAADMGRGYDTRNRTSPKVMGRRKTPNRGSKTSACGDQDPRVDVKQPRPHMSAITRAKGQVRGKGDPGSALSASWPVVAVVQGRGEYLEEPCRRSAARERIRARRAPPGLGHCQDPIPCGTARESGRCGRAMAHTARREYTEIADAKLKKS